MKRLLEICGVLAVHACRLAGRVARRNPVLRGESLAALLEDLGPTFVKIGQILSCRSDLLPPDIVSALSRLQDSVRPVPHQVLLRHLQEGLGRPLESLFVEIDPEPLGSASVAQVHRARLLDGRDVAVKVRRPEVERRVRADFRLLRLGARALAKAPGLRTMPMVELVEEIRRPVEMQLDFVREAQSNRRLRRLFQHVELVRIPSLVDELCTSTVLTMEYLPDLQKVTSTGLAPSQVRDAALAGLRALYKMIFLHGFVHADMHPGNVFLLRSGTLALLDTGLMAELSECERCNFVDFFFGLVNNRGTECAAIALSMALTRPSARDAARFERAMVGLIDRHSALPSRDFEVTRFVYELIEIQRACGIRGSTAFMTVVLSMVVYDGICKQLYPACNFQAEARPYLIAGRYGQRTEASLPAAAYAAFTS